MIKVWRDIGLNAVGLGPWALLLIGWDDNAGLEC